jgi:hypothetical protein
MAQHEHFNLDRHVSEQHKVDPLGKKWEIHGQRGTHLVHARPNPDRKDAIIPKDFEGKWTSASILEGKIKTWLSKQWDIAEEKARLAALKAGRATVDIIEEGLQELTKKKSPEESLAELPEEVKEELGQMLETDREKEAR